MAHGEKSTSKHKRNHDNDDSDRKHKRRRHSPDSSGSKRNKKKGSKLHIADDNAEEDMWEEKNIDMDGEQPIATDIPTADTLSLTSRAQEKQGDPPLPPSTITESTLKRDDWMMAPNDYADTNERSTGNQSDFFLNIGTELRKKPPPKNPLDDKPKVSSKELNPIIRGEELPERPVEEKKFVPGGPGSQWRMMKLRRVYETADEEGRPVLEVAMDRFGSMELFEQAQEERRILDERENRRNDTYSGRSDRKGKARDNGTGNDGEKRYMFTDVAGSGASSRSSSFRRPDFGDRQHQGSLPSTPSPADSSSRQSAPQNRRFDSLRLPSRGGGESPFQQSHTPIPSVMTPSQLVAPKTKVLSQSELNKLQAKVLRAKLIGAPDAEALEKEYERELKRSNGEEGDGEGSVQTKVEVLPTLDARGRLYDVGHGKPDEEILPGNRKKKEKFEMRDPKTGEILRYNPDDDKVTLGEMLRQEKFDAGMSDQKNLDAEYARAILSDGKFQNDLDYIDDNAEKLGRQKMRSDAMKRQFAINDYKRTQKVLATCPFCYGEDDSLPKAPVIAMGTRVYLSCTLNEELLEGHCLIVPIQHHLTMLEGDDDVWDEVKNFMKCLMRMFAEQDKGVVFYETVISLKWQNHTVIECVPLPWDKFEEIPGYFKESILMSEAEWSQHKKLIDFSSRPGGFRRAMVPNLPYFMVQFDYKGEKGYGHVIEGASEGLQDEDDQANQDPSSGTFPKFFAGEIIGNVMELEPRQWRRPKRIDSRFNKERVAKFRKMYDKFDWTGMIGK
ncbi:Cwf19-like protein [Abortiporus biennis]